MPALMATAEYVTKVHAVLDFDLANYSFRKTDGQAGNALVEPKNTNL
jgi:hypothetical protein